VSYRVDNELKIHLESGNLCYIIDRAQ
jgi:hypothetical protein